MNRYAFTNPDGIVVNVIVGNLTPNQQQLFLRDQAALFGATQVIEVEPDTAVWIGGSYTGNQFLPPQVVQGTSEESPALEVPDDALPG
jgi:hypothetical protein